MHIPPFWSKQSYSGIDRKGKERCYAAWGWSFESQAAAQQIAAERVRRVFENPPHYSNDNSYDYLERPLREEIREEIVCGEEQVALITRNRYGSLVLNTASVCFVDIDFPQPTPTGFIDALRLMFNKQLKEERKRNARERTIENVMQWSHKNPYQKFRLYETAAGLRLLFTDRLYNPTSEEVAVLLDTLGSDKLYRRLTVKQECFRARLTPKPWRCGCFRPPNRYPWETDQEEQTYRQWEADYDNKIGGYGICRLITTIGDSPEDHHIASIIELHDQFTCLDPALPLA
jgi:hypothetical protein